MIKKKVLVISFSRLEKDPRVNRQVRTLAKKYDVTFAGFGVCNIEGVAHVALDTFAISPIKKILKGLMLVGQLFETFYWWQVPVRSALSKLVVGEYDMVVANDIDSLPLAILLANSSPVYFDAHEYHPKEFDDSFAWRVFYKRYKNYLCKKYMSKAKVMTTVCQGIAEEYQRNFMVKPAVVMNLPDYIDLSPSKVDDTKIRMVHHGSAIPSRHLELMVDMFEYLDERFSLDFMLVPTNPEYLAELKSYASKYSAVRFVDPVSMAEIPSEINKYDLGVYILPESNFNHAHALPNKFFEFIQARLGVAIGPSPELRRIASLYQLGVISPSYSPKDMADCLLALNANDVIQLKLASNKAAQELNFAKCEEIILSAASSALS